MTAIEQQIEDLGVWAAGLELSAADPSTPYWLRKQDAERAQRIREQQFILAGQLRPAPPLHRCHTSGCPNVVAGDDYCARCSEEINGQPCTFAEILSEMPKWARRLFWTSVFALAAFALSILLILL